MINFKNANFVKSVDALINSPKEGYGEVLLVGKSNVGKSSLINAICVKKSLAFTSSKPGHTRLLNYYNIDNKMFLVDAPGYGYAKGNVDLDKLFMNMMNDYFSNCKSLKLVLVLLDSRRELSDDDLDIINYLITNNIPYQLVVTKSDKTNQSEKAKLVKHLTELSIDVQNVVYTSTLQLRSIDKLRNIINSYI